MPSIHYLNPPPNPFWDFVAGLEDHPFFAGQGRFGGQGNPPNYKSRENVAREAPEASGSGENAKDKQPSAEDPPEVDPATLSDNADETQLPGGLRGGPWRGRGRFANALDGGEEPSRRGHGCRGRGGFEGRDGPHHHPRGGPMGPPPFMYGRGPWWARHVPGMDNDEHPHPREDPHHGPGPHHGPPHHRGPHGPHHGRGGFGRRHGPEGFNLPEFLNNLGNRLGVDLSGAAEGLGLDRFTGPRANPETDFEPRGDVFDTAEQYIIHLSLPGAKKGDVGVDWDGENSVLRIAGVVHRPGADEEMLSQLVVDQRKREVGVFEKNIRLGTRRDPASIDVNAISAKMTDGVLVVRVPKVEVEHKTREVPIAGSSPARSERQTEKESLLDAADEEMYDAASAPAPAAAAVATEASKKEQIAEHAHEQDTRSETMDVQHREETVPVYQEKEAHDEESDWEKDGSEDEGEYVKINVD